MGYNSRGSFTVLDLKELADEHDVTFVGIFQDSNCFPYGPVYIIMESKPSHLRMSEFESRVREHTPAGVVVKVAWAS